MCYVLASHSGGGGGGCLQARHVCGQTFKLLKQPFVGPQCAFGGTGGGTGVGGQIPPPGTISGHNCSQLGAVSLQMNDVVLKYE